MDTLARHCDDIRKILSKYASIPYLSGQINSFVIVSEDRHHFLLMNEGWDGKRHIHRCLIHVQVIEDKIWIHFDGTEDGIAEELVAAGIPKEQIVLAFHPSYIRPHTGYAIA